MSLDSKKPSGSRSRRDFLKLSGQVAAASAFAGMATAPCHASGDGTIKLALVGCGGRGTGAVADAFAATGGPVFLGCPGERRRGSRARTDQRRAGLQASSDADPLESGP